MGWYGSTDGAGGSSGRRPHQRNNTNANYIPNPRIEKIIENEFVGSGIKRTPAYEWKVNQKELEKFRQEFWSTRTQGAREVWDILHNAISASPEDAQAFISASGLTAHAGIMTLVFDENRFPYRVPIACINDPARFLPSDVEQLNNEAKPDEETYENMKVRTIGGPDYEFSASSYKTVGEIKIEFLDATDRSKIDSNNCIFLFRGRKLNDQLPLYSINLDSEMVIQAMLIGDTKSS